MKRLFLVTPLFLPILLFGAQDNLISSIQNQIHSMAQSYYSVFSQSALSLLYAFGVIQLVITFGFMAVRGELEITGATAQLIKTALIIGFFATIIKSPSYFNGIYEGVTNLALKAGGNKANLENVFENMFIMWDKLGEDTLNPIKLLGLLIVGIVASAAITILVAQALTYYAFAVLSSTVGILFLGFGAFDQTRPWAINAITNVFRNALKFMMTLLVLAITFDFIQTTSDAVINDFSLTNMITLAMTAILILSINAGVGGFIDSYFTGSGGGENSRGTQLIQTAMNAGAGATMGAAMGAKGAADTIAAAKGSGQEMGTFGKMGAYAGGMTSGAVKGGVHGGDSFTKNWAKGIDPNYSGGGSTATTPNQKIDWSNDSSSSAPQDGDVGGGTSGSIAEPKVGGEINKNQY